MDVAPGLISDTKFSLDLSGFGQVQSFFPVRDGHRFVACTLSKLEAEIEKDGRKRMKHSIIVLTAGKGVI
jgi:hypothetical protein